MEESGEVSRLCDSHFLEHSCHSSFSVSVLVSALITQAGELGATESTHHNLIPPLFPSPTGSSSLCLWYLSPLLFLSSSLALPVCPSSNVLLGRSLKSVCVLSWESSVGL